MSQWGLNPRTTDRPGDPLQGFADDVARGVLARIVSAITDHPRSQQRIIGPSELGIPCVRALLYKLAKWQEPEREPGWKPTIGTAVHAWLEGIFEKLSHEGWKTENRVIVGNIGGEDIGGTCDLFKPEVVIDWKIVGPKQLSKYKVNGPGEQYRRQAHLYGRGWQNAGQPVKIVMIVFLPRDGELRDAYFWWEQYDENIALETLKRAERCIGLIETEGLQNALKLFPTCNDPWCRYCAIDHAKEKTGSFFRR